MKLAAQHIRFIAISVLSVLLAIGLGFLYWTSTPTYAIYRLAEAVHDKNAAQFYDYFDVEKVVGSVVEGVTTAELAKGTKENSGFAALGNAIGLSLAGILNPQLSRLVKLEIDRRFSPTVPADAHPNQLGKAGEPLQFASLVKDFDISRITRHGLSAVAEVHVKALNRPYVVQVKMEDEKGWKVVGIANIAALMEQFQADKGPFTEESNAAIRQEMARILKMSQSEIIKESSWMGLKRSLNIRFTLDNLSDTPITALSLSLHVLDGSQVLDIHSLELPNADLKPHSSKAYEASFAAGLMDSKASAVFQSAHPTVIATFDRIRFEGRAPLEIARGFDEIVKESNSR